MVEGEASRVTQGALSSQKDTDEEVREFLQNNLNLQGKVSPLREVCEPPDMEEGISVKLHVCIWCALACI